MENNESKKMSKREKIEIVIIVILLAVILGLVGMKFINKDEFIKTNKKVTKEKTKEELKDITNDEIVLTLEKNLISNDGEKGLYFNKKITSNEYNNIDLIMFNIKKYSEENNLEKDQKEFDSVFNSVYKINKNALKTYIQKKYNTNYDYGFNHSINEMTSTASTDLTINNVGLTTITNDDNYYIGVVGKDYGIDYIKTKLVKAVKDTNSNTIYIYNKAVFCLSEAGSSECQKSISDTYNTDVVLDCNVDENGNLSESCPSVIDINAEGFINRMADYTLENLSDELYTFKHTFKKYDDGNYYWVSSEIDN